MHAETSQIDNSPAVSSRIAVCALVPYALDSIPSQRFRLEQWAPVLAEQGIDLRLVPFADAELMALLHRPGHVLWKAHLTARASLGRVGLLRELERFDLVVIHRAAMLAGPAWLERLIARRRRILFDFDDAIWRLHTTAANRYVGRLKFPGKTAAICRLSAQVVVGNAYLADYAQKHNANVRIVPSSVDTERFRPTARGAPDRPLVVGWTGSSTSQTYLEWFAPTLAQLQRRRPFELRVHSDRRPELRDVTFSWRPWQPRTEADEVGAFDIGLMPMPEDPWARGKCAMKALIYMAVGIPVVSSAVGTNREVIAHGENGFLATTTDEWARALETLIDDGEARRRMGAAGRKLVEERYSRRYCATLFADAVRAALRTNNG